MALGKLTAKTGGSGEEFEVVPKGKQIACLIGIIDEGTQDMAPGQFQKEWTKAHKVLLVWEMLENKKEDGSPMYISEEYTYSFDVKAGLRQMIEVWLDTTFTDGSEVDWTASVKGGGILGRYCYLTVEHAESKKGRTFAKLKKGSVQSVPKEARESAGKLRPQTTPFVWSIEEPEMPALADELYAFGQKLKDRLAAAHERAAMNAQHSSPTMQEPPAAIEKGAHGGAQLTPSSGITPPQAPSPAKLKKENAAKTAATVESDDPF